MSFQVFLAVAQTAQAAPSDNGSTTAPAKAAKSDKPATPDDRATEFKAVEGGGETRSGTTLVVEAYALIWMILMTWLFLVWRKQAKLHARLDDLERAIDKAALASKSSKL